MNSLSIVIPVYNEEECVKETIDLMKKVLSRSGISWEIIAVDDGSEDNSLQELQQFNDIKIVSHRKNKGYGSSLKTGMRLSKYNNICITDADSTYPIEKIPELFETFLKSNLDMVVGVRTGKNVAYPFMRRIPKFFIGKLANYISNTKIPDLNSGLRIFKKDIALKFFNLFPDGFSFTTTITMAMLCRGYNVEFIPIDYFKRGGKSKISPFKDTVGFFSQVSKIAIFFNPLKVFSPFVVILVLISLVFLIRDIFVLQNLSQSAVLFPILTGLVFFMGLIADMISKK